MRQRPGAEPDWERHSLLAPHEKQRTPPLPCGATGPGQATMARLRPVLGKLWGRDRSWKAAPGPTPTHRWGMKRRPSDPQTTAHTRISRKFGLGLIRPIPPPPSHESPNHVGHVGHTLTRHGEWTDGANPMGEGRGGRRGHWPGHRLGEGGVLRPQLRHGPQQLHDLWGAEGARRCEVWGGAGGVQVPRCGVGLVRFGLCASEKRRAMQRGHERRAGNKQEVNPLAFHNFR